MMIYYLQKQFSKASFPGRYMILIHDLLLGLGSLPLGLLIWAGSDFLEGYSQAFWVKHVVVYGLLSMGIYLWMQTYRGVWAFVSWYDLGTLFLAATYINLLFLPLVYLMGDEEMFPVPALGLCWGFHVFFLGISRLSSRVLQARNTRESLGGKEQPVLPGPADSEKPPLPSALPCARILLVGSDKHMASFIRQISKSPYSFYELLGLVDENPGRVGRFIHGVEIVGTLRNLETTLQDLKLKQMLPVHLVISEAYLHRPAQMQKFYELARRYQVDLNHLPPHYHLRKILIPQAA